MSDGNEAGWAGPVSDGDVAGWVSLTLESAAFSMCSAPRNERTETRTENRSELNGEAINMRYSTIYS